MRWIAPLVSAIALFLAASSVVSAQKQFALLATVTDPSGGDVTTVEPADVKVTEGGKPATVVKVDSVQRVPKLQVLIDNGVGMPSESVGDLRKAVQGFLEALPPTLEVTLVTTAPQPRFLERATTDHAKLLQAVSRLTPDTGSGHFVDSLSEAVDRIAKDKADASDTIFALGTLAGDNNVRDSDVKKIMAGVQARQTTVHAVLLTRMSATSNSIQFDMAQAASGATGGRFESINVPNRLITLLPEIGAQIAKNSGPGAKQFRITFDRPAGASGDLGAMTIGIAGKAVTGVALDRSVEKR